MVFYTIRCRFESYQARQTFGAYIAMRMTQFQGLNDRAQNYLTFLKPLWTDKIQRVYPNGQEESFEQVTHGNGVISKPWKTLVGLIGEEIQLFQFTLPNGNILFEDDQCTFHSSGPVIFTALKDDKGAWVEETLWTEAEIKQRV